jgi:hypothetical protein
MSIRDPEKNFKVLWETFNKRYPFFQLRNVNWKKQHDTYRSRVTSKTSDDELFEIFCQMLDPLNDGHVELKAKASAHRKKRYFTRKNSPDSGRNSRPARLSSSSKRPKRLLSTIVSGGPRRPRPGCFATAGRRNSATFGFLELEGVTKRSLTAALDKIARDFRDLKGIIIDIRENPGGEDSIAIAIINRFCDRKRVAFTGRRRLAQAKMTFRPSRPGTSNRKATYNSLGQSCS